MGLQAVWARLGRTLMLATFAILLLIPLPATGQEDEPDAEELAAGAELYRANCGMCHGPEGLGIPGSIPPLVDNPRMNDARYIAEVIVNGVDGELEVGGVTYFGQMSGNPTLSEDEVEAIVAFIQAGLQVPAGAESTTTTTEPTPATTAHGDLPPPAEDAETIRLGAEVYSAQCAGCHQAGGAGIPGSFPPLIDNPHVSDAAYLADVIRNGLQGPLEVGGVEYDGVMPAFPVLSDEDVSAVIAYIQGGFALPAGSDRETGTALPLATGALPGLAGMAILAAFAIAAAAGLFVLWPRLASPVDRLSVPWLDATLRSVGIFLYLVIGTAVIPSAVLKTGTVSRMDRVVQDLIGSGLWFAALAVGLGALWWAHRESRI